MRLVTLGRAIHRSRRVGSTGWIAGVAVFHRALNATELAHLAPLSHSPRLSRPPRRSPMKISTGVLSRLSNALVATPARGQSPPRLSPATSSAAPGLVAAARFGFSAAADQRRVVDAVPLQRHLQNQALQPSLAAAAASRQRPRANAAPLPPRAAEAKP